MDARTDVAALVDELGAAEVGRRYVARLMATVCPTDDREIDLAPGELLDARAYQAIWLGEDEHGHPLPAELRWQVSVAALHACPDDDDLLWRLGDGPFDHMLDVAELRHRLRSDRDDPFIRRLYRAMQRCLPSEGVISGWWFDEDLA